MTKKILLILTLSAILLSSNIFAAKLPTMLTKMELEKFEQNLLEGIKSDNYGLRASATYILGELRSDKSVIALMGVLHNEKEEGGRIVAALALYKIGDARGLYAVKQAAKFDDSERVRRQCEKFYFEHLMENNS